MKSWQIFLVGILAAVAFFALPAYESAVAGVAASAIVALIVLGFLLRPRKDVFYLRTTVRGADPDGFFVVEHDRLAVHMELTRLWLLFIPTFAALAFLVVTSVHGTTWRMTLFGDFEFLYGGTYLIVVFFRLLVAAVLGMVYAWLGERWVLRDATACSADSVQALETRILYSFRDSSGEYYGGEGFPMAGKLSYQLRTIVFYRIDKPHLNKIAMCCLFHRPVIIGRGVTDLDEQETAVHLVRQVVAQPR